MDTVVVTLRHNKNKYDLVLPTAVPLAQLAPIWREELGLDGWQARDGEVLAARNAASGVVIRPEQTLEMAGAAHGDVLDLISLPAVYSPSAGRPADATWGRPYLQCAATGQSFTLRGRSIRVGRGSQCQVNISRLPGAGVVSRRHAQLSRRSDGFWLKDERSANGTLLNGQKLRPDESVKLNDGNRIQFGVNGPELIFYQG